MRRVTAVVIAVVVAAVAVGLVLTRPRPEWSSKDTEAVAELLKGREALGKLYFHEAVEHFRTALARDSRFVVARLMLASALMGLDQREAAMRELDQVLETDPATLRPREVRMLEMWRLQRARKEDELVDLLKRYAAEVPDDADIPRQLAAHYWMRGDEEEAAKWAEAALKISPNEALAYNLLGYIEMSRGNFAASESALRKYTFIAPNQSNPHDSLGELYTVTGRWDDAVAEFEKALAVNPKFFPAYLHIARIATFRGDAETALATAKQGWDLTGMSAESRELEATLMQAWAAWSRRDDAAFVAVMRGSKPAYGKPEWVLAMAIALANAGDPAAAREVEERARDEGAAKEASSKARWSAVLGVAAARRQLAEGQLAAAAATAEKADAVLTYSIDDAFLKLCARCIAATALARGGDTARATELVAEVARVNPVFPALARCRQEIGAR